MAKVFVEREQKISNRTGKPYFVYFINGVVRGVNLRVSVVPPDVGGFKILDIVYNGDMKADLIVTPFEMKDDYGKSITGNTFKVRSYDENGEVYECSIKPSRPSDKNALNMMLR